MIKRTLKRTLSIFLTLVLIATTFFIFDPSVLKTDANAWIDVEANTAGSTLPNQSANAPETIYITPGGNQFQYYSLLNVDTRTAGESTSTTGSVSFSHGTATEVRLYLNQMWHKNGQNSYEDVSDSSSTLLRLGDGSNSANPIAAKIDDDTDGTVATKATNATVLKSGTSSVNYTFLNTQCTLTCDDSTEGQVYIIEWCVEYKVGDDYHYRFMYTGIYKPTLNLAGVTGVGLRSAIAVTSTPKVSAFAFITGAMKYSNEGNAECLYKNNTSGVWAAPLVQFVGYADNNTSYSIPTQEDAHLNHFSTSGSVKNVTINSSTVDSEDRIDFYSTYSSYGSYTNPTSTSSDNHNSAAGAIGVAYMVVDTSRFTNYNQIPYLSTGFVRYYAKAGGNAAKITSISTPGGEIYVSASYRNLDVDEDNSYAHGLYGLNGSIQSGGLTLMIDYDQSKNILGVGTHTCSVRYGIGLHTTAVDKNAIRKAYCALLTSNVDRVTCDDYSDSSYYSKMMTQARLLCDPTATPTDSSCTLSESTIDTAQEAVISANTTAVLYFYVPETIYLNPKDRNTFQYYVDRENADNGDLRKDGGSADITKNNATDGSKTGNVYFNCPGATSVSISYSGGNVSLGYSSSTEKIATTMTGSWGSAMEEGTTGTITWTATYTLDGQTYTVNNYTVVYSPLCTTNSTVAVQVGARSASSRAPSIVATGWITGFHSMETNSDTTNRPAEGDEEAYGGMIDPPLTDYSVTSGGDNFPMDSDSDSNYTKFVSGGTGYSAWYKHSAGDNGTVTHNSKYNGVITVDYSRYANFSQIPQLVGGVDTNCQEQHRHYKAGCYEWIGSSSNGNSPNYTNLLCVGDGSSDNEDGCHTDGERQPYKLDATVNATTNYVLLSFAYRQEGDYSSWGSKVTRSATIIGSAFVKVNPVTKETLRKEINDQISSGKSQAWYTSGTWSTYASALSTACTTLGNLKATQTQINDAREALSNAATALQKNTGTATVYHKTTTGTTLVNGTATDTFATETRTYYYGSTVSAGSEDYTGYTLSSATRSAPSSKTLTVSSDDSEDGKGASDSVSNVTSNCTWTFNYAPNKYDVTYVTDGGTFNGYDESHTYSDIATYNASFKVGAVANGGAAAAAPTKTGYNFDGWKFDLNGTTYQNGDTISRWTWASDGGKFTAVWSAKSYVVKYKNIDNSTEAFYNTNEESSTFIYGESISIPDSTGVETKLGARTGYTLNGLYNKSSDGSAISFSSNVSIESLVAAQNPTDPATGNPIVYIYADWSINTYYLDLNGTLDGVSGGNISGYGTADVKVNGSTVGNDVADFYQKYNYGSTYEITDIKATEGHYYDDLASGSSSLTGTIGAGAVSVNLKFNTEQYTITFDENGGSDVTDWGTVKYGSSQTVPTTTKTGYTFGGWYDENNNVVYSENQKGTIVTVKDFGDNNALVTLYAKWTAKSVNVTYKAGEGSGDDITVNSAFTYGGNYQVKGSNTFTAPSTKTVTFNYGNGAAWADGTASATKNVSSNASFAYWTCNKKSGSTFSADTSYSTTALGVDDSCAITLTANWSWTQVTLPTAIKTGYTFAGWYDAPQDVVGANLIYDKKVTTVEGKDYLSSGTLYAHFTANDQTLTVYAYCNTVANTSKFENANTGGTVAITGGTTTDLGKTATKTVPSDDPITITASEATGYKFSGWYTSSDLSGTAVSTSATYSTTMGTSATNYYAKFELDTYKVTAQAKYNTKSSDGWTNGATGGTVQVDGDIDGASGTATSEGYVVKDTDPYVTLIASPVAGYHFAGWYTTSTVSGTASSTSKSYTVSSVTADTTYYARFDISKNTLSVNPNGGSVKVGTTTYTSTTSFDGYGYHNEALTIYVPTKTGYNFNGWTESGSGGTLTSASDGVNYTFTFTKDTTTYDQTYTITAKWAGKTYSIIFNGNGATSGSYANITKTYGTALTIPATAATAYEKTGYDFKGWDTSSTATTATYAYPSSSWTLSDDLCTINTDGSLNSVTLYAVWAKHKYTVNASAYYNTSAAATTWSAGATGGKVKINASGTAGATATGSIEYQTSYTIYATPATGYACAGLYTAAPTSSGTVWGTALTGSTDSSGVLSYTKSANANANYYARFDIQKYTVNAYAYFNTAGATTTWNQGTTGGTVKVGTGTATTATIYYNTSFTITATPKTGYACAGLYTAAPTSSGTVWGTALTGSTDSSGVLTYTKNIGAANENYYARFDIQQYTVNAYAYCNTAAASTTFGAATSSAGGTVAINSGTEGITATDTGIYYGTTYTVSATNITGWTFEGWYTTSALTTRKTDSTSTSATFTKTGENEEVYAKFTINSYTLTVYAYSNTGNGTKYSNNDTGGTVQIGSGTPSEMATTSVYYGVSAPIKAIAETGYTFVAWYTDSGLTKNKNTSAERTFTKKTLNGTNGQTYSYYAKFTAKSFTINLDSKGGALEVSDGTSSVTAYYNGSVELDARTKVYKFGSKFLGWSTSSAATTATYTYISGICTLDVTAVNSLFPSSGTVANLYAVYENYTYSEVFLAAYNTGANQNSYTVGTAHGTLSKNSGVTEIKPGDTILDKVTYTADASNTGYHFSGIKYGICGSVLSDGTTISKDTVSYTAVAGEAMNSNVQVTGNNTKIYFIAFYDVNSYALNLYAESQDASGDYGNNSAGGTVKINSGTAGATATATVYYGVSTSLVAASKSGYTFKGWYTEAPTNNKTWGTVVNEGTTYTPTLNGSNATAYSYYARFDLADYVAYAYAEFYEYGVNEATGKGKAGTTGGTVTVSASDSGAYKADSATTSGASPVSVNVKYNQQVTYTANPADGYVFVGWYYSEGASYTGDEGDIQLDYALDTETTYNVEMPNDNIRIHGKFVPANFILAFNTSEGVLGQTAAVTLTYGKSITLDATSIPTCSGKTFLGWAETSTATTATYTYTNNTCTISETVVNRWYGEKSNDTKTVYAVWQIATYTITLDLDGGNSGQTKVENVELGKAVPTVTSLPAYSGYRFDGYYSEPGGQGKQYYNANGTSANNWDIADDSTLYAKWICPVLTDATYDADSGKWTYTYETTSGGTVTSSSSDKTFDAQTITDKGLGLTDVKEITSRDRTEKNFIIEQNQNTKDINLNHYTSSSLTQILNCVTATNTDALRSALSQPELNVYVSKLVYYLNLALSGNCKKTETTKTKLEIYETQSKLKDVKLDTITDPADSATGVTYSYPSSSYASSYVYTNKWSEVNGSAVDYFVYTNSTSPVIAIEIDDGDVLTTTEFTSDSKTASSYPTKATVTARDADGAATGDIYTTGAVPATDNISEAWFAPYVEQDIGVGTDETKREHDYNAKTVLYLTPTFDSKDASGTVNEVVYTITPSDDAYVSNSGFTSAEIADVNSSIKDDFSSLNDTKTESTSVTICISYHNAMNGASDEGGTGDCLQMEATQLSDGESYWDKWIDQMHLIRTSGGADNWELPLTSEAVYPVDDATYRNTNGYVLGSFAYVFDANTEPNAAERAYNDDFSAAKDLIISSIKGNLSSAYNNIKTHSFYSYDSSDSNSGLGMFAITGWSSNYYPRPDSYVYVHLIDRWGNVFNYVWKNLQVDAAKPKITGTASTSFNVNESGGSNIAYFTLDGVDDVTFITDLDSTFENNVYTTSGNSFVIDTGLASTKLQLAVYDNAGNKLSGKIPTNKQGLITFTVTDDCADLSDGAYTFMFNDVEVNLWAREPALVRSADMSASSTSGEPCTFTIKTMDTAKKIQLIENGSTRTYTPGMSNVTVVDNGDGTMSWTIKMSPLSIGEHTFQIKCKDASGWNDCDITLTTTVSAKPVVNEAVVQKLSDTSCKVGEKAVLELTTVEGTQAVYVEFDNGYSKTISRSDDIVVSSVDGVEVWRFTGGTFSEAGQYTAKVYAKYNGVWNKTDAVTCTITVTTPVATTANILAVTILDEEVNAGESATIEIITNKATQKLQFVNADGTTKTYTSDNAQIVDNGNGTLTWTVSKNFKVVGENEVVVKAKSSAGWTEAATYGTVIAK